MHTGFNDVEILTYIGLPNTYEPLPSISPLEFLQLHLHQLPPHLMQRFSLITTPKQRTIVPEIRNRRLRHTETSPPALSFVLAKANWPLLWHGRERQGQEEAREEKEWAENEFLEGKKQHIGKLGSLLGDYEEEREAERLRNVRRNQIVHDEFIPEEDESDSDENEQMDIDDVEESPAESRRSFERLVRERFIYGLLEDIDYDSVDWNEQLDVLDERDAEDRWFEDEDES
ncbi:hypothetical protein BJ138DRAFT_1079554 [Hygrophoropsis aurantiaca]|uniref:Uncharacterized protein n=1 Tax=Hygrophoropsis aurantiaca TaxID=72124 RepID=A0ACB8AN94_9AGAM|nr:hypothetical protein BJ138DRAFT_1079554 [Hygrophoropsis aurantiaca]